jgi:hypothetical protein
MYKPLSTNHTFSLQSIPINFCPVCTLRCTCSKCSRKLEDVAAKLKAECQVQDVSAESVVMDTLYELCSVNLKDGSKTKPGDGGIGKKKQEKKRKRSSTKAKIDMDSARGEGGGVGSKRIRSPGLYEVDNADRPRLSTARSTRSSPSATDNDFSVADGRPTKRSRVESNVNPRTGVLKVPPTEFPTEVGVLRWNRRNLALFCFF